MIETERLVLRQWRDADRAPFAALNADLEVMEHFPAPLTQAQANAGIDRQAGFIAQDGLGFRAVERCSDGAFLGMVGVKRPPAAFGFAPALEVGWRLARAFWGRGYATEAAAASLRFAFDRGAEEVVSFTAEENLRSQAVMRRIGMHRASERDFDHPHVPEGHRLRRHIVYALRREPAG